MSLYHSPNFDYSHSQRDYQIELDQFHSEAFGRPQDYPQKSNEEQKRPFIASVQSRSSTNKFISNNTYIPDWPNEPRPLKRSKGGTFGAICYDALNILAPFPFLALGVIAARSDGRVVHESNWNKIQTAMSAVGRWKTPSGSLLTSQGCNRFSGGICSHRRPGNNEYIWMETRTRCDVGIYRANHGQPNALRNTQDPISITLF